MSQTRTNRVAFAVGALMLLAACQSAQTPTSSIPERAERAKQGGYAVLKAQAKSTLDVKFALNAESLQPGATVTVDFSVHNKEKAARTGVVMAYYFPEGASYAPDSFMFQGQTGAAFRLFPDRLEIALDELGNGRKLKGTFSIVISPAAQPGAPFTSVWTYEDNQESLAWNSQDTVGEPPQNQWLPGWPAPSPTPVPTPTLSPSPTPTPTPTPTPVPTPTPAPPFEVDPVIPPEIPTDFIEQGASQFYLAEWTGSAYVDMVWGTNHWGTVTWTGPGGSQRAAIWRKSCDDPAGLLYLHPGMYTDAVVKWVAPEAGTATIRGTAASLAASSDGVRPQILNGQQVLHNVLVPAFGSSSFDLSTPVAAGTPIYFRINRNGNPYSDSASLEATIELNGKHYALPQIRPTSSLPANPFMAQGANGYALLEREAGQDMEMVWGTNHWGFVSFTGPQVYRRAAIWRNCDDPAGTLRWHPGLYTSAVVRWVAPGAGTVLVQGAVTSINQSEDGIRPIVLKGQNVLYEAPVPRYGTANMNFSTDVVAGTPLYFVLNHNGNPYWDSATLELAIQLNGQTYLLPGTTAAP